MAAEAALGLEAASIAAHCIELIHMISKAVIKSRRFKKECAQLSSDAVLLLGILEKNRSVLKELDVTRPLTKCLTDCLVFVIQCQEWGPVSVFIEVVFRNRYPKLSRELRKWIMHFNTEIGVCTWQMKSNRQVEGLSALDRFRSEWRDETQKESNRRSEFYGDIRAFEDYMAQIDRVDLSAVRNLRDVVPHFSEYDRRLSLRDEGGQIRGTMADAGPIICHVLEEAELGGWAKLPKIIHIYTKLSARLQVQKLYGILEKGVQRYAIMEDLSLLPTLASMVENGEMLSLTDRLRIAWEIANTIAYLHQVGILIKSLSDTTVSLKTVANEIRPIITDLESARLVAVHNSLCLPAYR